MGNETDISGQAFLLPGPKLGMGSAKLYKDYFDVYKNSVDAAVEFERKKGLKVQLGRPALAWTFSFKFGNFNWCKLFYLSSRIPGLELVYRLQRKRRFC